MIYFCIGVRCTLYLSLFSVSGWKAELRKVLRHFHPHVCVKMHGRQVDSGEHRKMIKKKQSGRVGPHCLSGGIWSVVRTQCGTTCLYTNVSCAWRTLKGPCGQWTRWNSTREGRSGVRRARWPSQSSGTSTRPAILRFFPFVHCVFCDFYIFF